MSDELRDYLLEKSTPEERSLLEERMFADDAFFDLMLEAENELADAYAAGELSPDDAAKFAAGRRHRIVVAKALLAREQHPRAAHKVSWRWALALAASLVVVAVAAWLYKGTATQQSHEKVMAIFLTATVTRERSAVRSITLPKGTEELRVTVAVPAVTPDTALHAELHTAAGNLVWQGVPQSWEGDLPVFRIPADRVPSGAAELDVFAGAGERHLAGVYPLRFERL
jgi:anti-sigma-K factor RskA